MRMQQTLFSRHFFMEILKVPWIHCYTIKRGPKNPKKGTQRGPVLENVFVPPPTNFGQKVPPKARNRDKADFATKVRKSSINHVNVNHEQ